MIRPTVSFNRTESLDADILLVDDEPSNLIILQHVLQKVGYQHIRSASHAREALGLIAEAIPDLVLTDYHIPHRDGLSLIAELRVTVPPTVFLPIILLTGDLSPDLEQRALMAGANDFLHKPINATQVQLRVSNLLHLRFMHQTLQHQNQRLANHVETARAELLERLALAAEVRDYETSRHTERVGLLSALVAKKLGFTREAVELLRHAATLHDIGKLGIPDQILLKPGALSPMEFDLMKTHTAIGAKLLANSSSELIKQAEVIAATHHERYDGSGYPLGLRGDEIPLVGQIVGVVDVFDALLSQRPYKKAWSLEQAVAEMRRLSGRWFSPRVAVALLEVVAEQNALFSPHGTSRAFVPHQHLCSRSTPGKTT